MAGSGKTTLMAALQRSLTTGNDSDGQEEGGDEEEEEGENHIEDNAKDTTGKPKEETEGDESGKESVQESSKSNDHHHAPIGYCLNLDPATKLVPFGASIDIRDTVDYKVSF